MFYRGLPLTQFPFTRFPLVGLFATLCIGKKGKIGDVIRILYELQLGLWCKKRYLKVFQFNGLCSKWAILQIFHNLTSIWTEPDNCLKRKIREKKVEGSGFTFKFYHSKIESKYTSLKKYTNWAKLIYFLSFWGNERRKKPNISHLM